MQSGVLLAPSAENETTRIISFHFIFLTNERNGNAKDKDKHGNGVSEHWRSGRMETSRNHRSGWIW
jgi:hypothetical protein